MSLGFFVRRYESAICENRLTVKATPRRNAYGHRNGKP
jgi:hypothetical protein